MFKYCHLSPLHPICRAFWKYFANVLIASLKNAFAFYFQSILKIFCNRFDLPYGISIVAIQLLCSKRAVRYANIFANRELHTELVSMGKCWLTAHLKTFPRYLHTIGKNIGKRFASFSWWDYVASCCARIEANSIAHWLWSSTASCGWHEAVERRNNEPASIAGSLAVMKRWFRVFYCTRR